MAEEHLKGAELVGGHGGGYRIPKILTGLQLGWRRRRRRSSLQG